MLRQRKKDYLTVNQVRDGLPVEAVRSLGLKKGKSSVKEVINRLLLHLGENLTILRNGRSSYVAFNLLLKDIVLNKIRENPNLSSKRLRSLLPINNRTFVEILNDLFKNGELKGVINEKTHLLKGFIISSDGGSAESVRQDDVQEKKLFKNAYDKVSKGRRFVRIHLIREELNWSNERFVRVLEWLKSELVIQLQGGDPSTFSKSEIEQSYIDNTGRLRLTATWITDD